MPESAPVSVPGRGGLLYRGVFLPPGTYLISAALPIRPPRAPPSSGTIGSPDTRPRGRALRKSLGTATPNRRAGVRLSPAGRSGDAVLRRAPKRQAATRTRRWIRGFLAHPQPLRTRSLRKCPRQACMLQRRRQHQGKDCDVHVCVVLCLPGPGNLLKKIKNEKIGK